VIDRPTRWLVDHRDRSRHRDHRRVDHLGPSSISGDDRCRILQSVVKRADQLPVANPGVVRKALKADGIGFPKRPNPARILR
jgi:hypothetical protein